MDEIGLLGSFAGLLLLALLVIVTALPKARKVAVILGFSFIVCSTLAYWHWGSWSTWVDFSQREVKQEKIKALLATIKSPDDLVRKLRQQLDNNPRSARGWYLLGRLYASQGQWQQARQAFVTAKELNPQDEQTLLNYVQAVWQLNNQQLDSETSTLLYNMLQKNPQQGDALALLAANAYQQGDTEQALNYWQRLLKLLPATSQEARSLRKMIAKAQQSDQ